MNEIEIFKNPEFGEIRTLTIDGEPWFVGKDVAERLGYENPTKSIRDHVDEEDKKMGVQNVTPSVTDSFGRIQYPTWINESGLYSLVLSSKLPTAKQFKRWVTSEVIPAIRKHGAYATPITIDNIIADPDFGIRLLCDLKAERDKNKELQAINSALTVDKAIMQPKAEFFDELVDRNMLTSFRDTAKELGIKEKVFIGFLIDKKYLFRDKKGKLTPYAGKNDGLFEVKETFNEKTKWSGTQTMVTPKGRETFRLLCKGL